MRCDECTLALPLAKPECRSTCPSSSPPKSRSQRTDLPTRFDQGRCMGHAQCSPMQQRSGRRLGCKIRTVEAARAVPPCIGHGMQRVSRSREKAPRNPTLAHSVEREDAGQAPVHYARDAPTSGSMVAGADFERLTTQLWVNRCGGTLMSRNPRLSRRQTTLRVDPAPVSWAIAKQTNSPERPLRKAM